MIVEGKDRNSPYQKLTPQASFALFMEPTNGKKVAMLIGTMMDKVSKLDAAIGKHDFSSTALAARSASEEHMQYCAQTIRPAMDELRKDADALEGEVADDFWPLPTYQEMLFVK